MYGYSVSFDFDKWPKTQTFPVQFKPSWPLLFAPALPRSAIYMKEIFLLKLYANGAQRINNSNFVKVDICKSLTSF